MPAAGLIIVEGNISAGKSTLCTQLADQLGYALYLEPTLHNPFLERFYSDPATYALPMQLWLLKQRYLTYVHALQLIMAPDNNTKGVILDRSIYSDLVFAEKNREDGTISEEGFAYYMELRQKLLQGLPAPHVLLYLDVSAEECHRRIHHVRQRSCEDGIPLEYLAGLDTYYKQMVSTMAAAGAADVQVIDWSKFGDADVVSAAVRESVSLRDSAMSAWCDAVEPMREFIFDADAVDARMEMSWVLPEAAAGDVEAVDPDLLSWGELADVRLPDSPTSCSPVAELESAIGGAESQAAGVVSPALDRYAKGESETSGAGGHTVDVDERASSPVAGKRSALEHPAPAVDDGTLLSPPRMAALE
jgi:NADH dehydrogenase (ubiquinone) 1 alpha subcomplex subunit 10